MNAQDSIISVMSALVATLTPIVTITANVADGSNWKLSMCDTYWMNTGTTITIGALNYSIVSFVKDDYIIVSGSSQPVGTTFTLDAPEFLFGNRRKVNTERFMDGQLANFACYLPPLETTHPNDDESDIAYTAPIRPVFLVEYDETKDNTTDQQTEIIEPLNALADYFVYQINYQKDKFEQPDEVIKRDWMNFGDPTVWGNDKLIFGQPLSGVEVRIDLDVMPDFTCKC